MYSYWIAGVAASVGGMAWAVRSPRSSLLAPSVYHGDRSRRSLALTFDDGPSESTPRLLELLAKHNVVATFFAVGSNVRRLPGVARELLAAGHEIGNHSYSHAMLQFKSPAFIYSELYQAQRAIEECTGSRPRWFRAPYGVRWFGLGRVQKQLGLRGVMWSVIGLDWKYEPVAVSARLLRSTQPGAIICLHDGRGTVVAPNISVTLDTIRDVLPRWIDQGWKFETVSQILCKTN